MPIAPGARDLDVSDDGERSDAEALLRAIFGDVVVRELYLLDDPDWRARDSFE